MYSASSGSYISSKKFNSEIDNIYELLSTIDTNTIYFDAIVLNSNFTPATDMYIYFGLEEAKDYYVRYLPSLHLSKDSEYRKFTAKQGGERINVLLSDIPTVVGNSSVTLTISNASQAIEVFLANSHGETFNAVATPENNNAVFTGVKNGVYVGCAKDGERYETFKFTLSGDLVFPVTLQNTYIDGANDCFVYGTVTSPQGVNIKVLEAQTVQKVLEDILSDIYINNNMFENRISDLETRATNTETVVTAEQIRNDTQDVRLDSAETELSTVNDTLVEDAGKLTSLDGRVTYLENNTGFGVNREYVDTQDAEYLTISNNYTDTQSTAALQTSKDYTDTQVANIGSDFLEEANNYTDIQIAPTKNEVIDARYTYFFNVKLSTLRLRLDSDFYEVTARITAVDNKVIPLKTEVENARKGYYGDSKNITFANLSARLLAEMHDIESDTVDLYNQVNLANQKYYKEHHFKVNNSTDLPAAWGRLPIQSRYYGDLAWSTNGMITLKKGYEYKVTIALGISAPVKFVYYGAKQYDLAELPNYGTNTESLATVEGSGTAFNDVQSVGWCVDLRAASSDMNICGWTGAYSGVTSPVKVRANTSILVTQYRN